jgi:hypothetical protein
MKKLVMLSLVLVLLPAMAGAQSAFEAYTDAPQPSVPGAAGPIWDGPGGVVLVDNGTLVTSPGTGVGGEDESILQNVTLGTTTLGAGHQVLNGNRVSDDFTITDADGWQIDTCTFFAYQTGGGPGGSTFTAVNVQIWDGLPGGAGSVIFGDNTTNVMTGSAFSNILRVAEDTTGTTNNRSIYANTVNMGGLVLAPGTYWLDWQTDGSLGSGPWAPPLTIIGNATTGDALQSIADNGVTWAPLQDGGTLTGLGMPFICEGTVLGGGDLPIPTINGFGMLTLLLALAAAAFVMIRRRQTV